MSESEKKLITDYATPPISLTIVGLVFLVLSPLVYLIAHALVSENWKAVVCGSVTGVMGLVFAMLRFCYMAAAKRAIKKAEENACAFFLIEDFRNGSRFLGGRIICGNYYFLSKGMGVIVRLSDIDEIRRETKTYKNVPTSENLTAVMKDRKKVTLVSIGQVETSHPPLGDILRHIERVAPDIKITDKRFSIL